MRKLLAIAALALAACGSSTVETPTVATPTLSPAAGTYHAAQSVAVACATAGAAIHVTTDGSTPTASSPTYAGAIAVTTTTTIKAIATAAGYATSAVGSATYVIGGGGSGDFLPVCNALFDKTLGLVATCFHANPDLINSFMGPMQASCADMQKEITAGLISFNASQGAACSSAVDALTCGSITGMEGVPVPPACDAALVGTVATGGTCYSSNDCASGYCTWDLPSGTCPGTCQPFRTLGQSCQGPDCADGLACDGGTCKAQSGVGGTCPCQNGLWCDGAVCTSYAAAGSTCGSATVKCDPLTICAGTPETCQAYAGPGAACDPADSICGLGYACDPGTSKCVSWPAIGQPCPDYICLTGYCDFLAGTPTCKAKLADGATCTPGLYGTDCVSGLCNATKCAPTPMDRCVMP